jgi:hypothetical protein
MPLALPSIRSAHVCALFLLGIFARSSPLSNAQASQSKRKFRYAFRLEVRDEHGTVVADLKSTPQPSTHASVALAFHHEYQPGDHIIVSGPAQIAVRVDDWIPECQVFLSDPLHSAFTYYVPYGQGEPATRSPFSRDSFSGEWHTVTARELAGVERSRYRNLAMNACDQEVPLPAIEGSAGQQPSVFPHASTNSVSRNLPDFQARNAIDGMTQNGHHGVWPYQSWGPELRNDLWWKIDFGRSVEVDKIRLMVRSDFPHDSFWQSAVIEFSDGGEFPIQILQTAEFQEFAFPKRSVSWLRLNKLVSADPSRWCSFIEVEVWGRDLK